MSTPRDYEWKYEDKERPSWLPTDEPYFLIRAQDSLAPEAVQRYADLVKRESDKACANGNFGLADNLLKQALALISMAGTFADWQLAHIDRVKKPRIR